jgi:hypothetical protein
MRPRTGLQIDPVGNIHQRAGRPVDALAGLSRQHRPGAFLQLDFRSEDIAPRHAAGGVDEHGLGNAAGRLRQADLRRAVLMQPVQVRGAVPPPKDHARLAAGALQSRLRPPDALRA